MVDLSAISNLLSRGVVDVQGAIDTAKSAAQTRADQSKIILDQATEAIMRMRQQEKDVNLPLLAWASGMGQPTRAGSFAESLSAGNQAAIPAIANQRKLETERAQQDMQLGLAKAQLPAELANQNLQFAKMPIDLAKELGPLAIQLDRRNMLKSIIEGAGGGAPSPGGPPTAGAPSALPPGMSPGFAPSAPGQSPGTPTMLLGSQPTAGTGAPAGQSAPDTPVTQQLAFWARMADGLMKAPDPDFMKMGQAYLSRIEAAARDGVIVAADGKVHPVPGWLAQQYLKQFESKRADLDATRQFGVQKGVLPGGATIEGLDADIRKAQQPPATPGTVNPPAVPSLQPGEGKVSPVVPPAPQFGGFPGFTAPDGVRVTELPPHQKKYMEESGKFMAELPDIYKLAAENERRLVAVINAYKYLHTGPFADTRKVMADLARVMGRSDWEEAVMKGDPAAFEAARKEIIQGSLDMLKAANSRFTQMEFSKVLSEGMPSPDMRPEAAHSLLTSMLAAARRDKDMAASWADAQRAGWQDPLSYRLEWSKANPQDLYKQAARRTIGNLKGMDPPSSRDELVPGTLYVIPQKGNWADIGKKYGFKPNDVVLYNGTEFVRPGAQYPLAR